MPNPGWTGRSEDLREALAAYKEHNGNASHAADALGIPRQTFNHRIKRAYQLGLHEGSPAPVPPGQVIKATSTLYRIDPETGAEEVMKWVKTREDGFDPSHIADVLKEAFSTCEGGAKITAPPATFKDGKLGLLPIADLHMGLYSWRPETGNNWSLERAMRVYRDVAQSVISSAPPCEEFVILGGGDQMHSDNTANKTAKSSNPLDVDGRYDKVLIETCHLFVYFVDLALCRNQRVIVRVLKGNHDEHSAAALAYFLMAWFRDEPRVTVDVSPSLFWWHRFGKVHLGATHGHEAKMKDMPGIMAHRRREEWGICRHSYIHMFHVHHSAQSKTEHNGVICEAWQTPAPQDAWHYGCGFLSGRSLSVVIYDKDRGEIGRVRMGIEDDT